MSPEQLDFLVADYYRTQRSNPANDTINDEALNRGAMELARQNLSLVAQQQQLVGVNDSLHFLIADYYRAERLAPRNANAGDSDLNTQACALASQTWRAGRQRGRNQPITAGAAG